MFPVLPLPVALTTSVSMYMLSSVCVLMFVSVYLEKRRGEFISVLVKRMNEHH